MSCAGHDPELSRRYGVVQAADVGAWMIDGGGWHPEAIAVCVPVRDERVLLPRLLMALSAQDLRGLPAVTLCLLFDGCTDGSESVTAEHDGRLPFAVVTRQVASGGAPNAGRARRMALALGERAVAGAAAAAAALLTTDADSEPAPDWIAANVAALAMADVVAGRILRRSGRGDAGQDRIEAYYDRLHAMRRDIDPVPWEARPSHHHSGGASLGFRARAYAALGGFEARPAGEDAAIVDAAHRAGLRVRRDAAVRVTTSSRRQGRAEGGLATHLARLDAGTDAGLMAHPFDAAWQYGGHAAARAAYPRIARPGIAARLAEALSLDPRHIRRVAADCADGEAFATRLVPCAPGGERRVTLDEAERALALLERQRAERAA